MVLRFPPLLPLVIVLAYCLTNIEAFAQSRQRYTIDLCPNNSPTTEAELNRRLNGVTTFAGFRSIMLGTFSQLEEGLVEYHVTNANGAITDSVFCIAAKGAAPTHLATLGSKGDDEPVRSRAELARIFSDSLVVVDTLALPLALAGESLPMDAYYLRWAQPGDTLFHYATLPAHGDTLLIARALFDGLAGNDVEIFLFNTARKGYLGHGSLHFLSAAQVSELRDLFCDLQRKHPKATPASLREACTRTVTLLHGRPYPPNAALLRCP